MRIAFNDGSVHNGVEYTSSLVMPKKGAPLNAITAHNGYSKKGRIKQAVTNSVMVLSLMVIAVFGGGGAQANWFEDALKSVVCGPEVYFNTPEPYTSGLTGMGFSPSVITLTNLLRDGDKNFANEPRTAFEKYGMSGANWTVYRGSTDEDQIRGGDYKSLSEDAKKQITGEDVTCIPFMEVVGTYGGNSIFMVTKALTAVSTTTYTAAYNSDFIDGFNDAAASIIEGPGGNNGLRDALYFEFLGVMLMLGALYLGYVGLVKRSSTTAGSAALWMVGSVVVGSLLLFNPTIIPRAANATVDAVTGAIMTGTTGLAINGQNANENLCYLPTVYSPGPGGSVRNEDQRGNAALTNQDRISRTVECSLWAAFVYTPWVNGQFGVSPTENLATEGDAPPTIRLGQGRNINNNWQLFQLEQQSLDAYALSQDKGQQVTQKLDNWGLVRDHIFENRPELVSSWNGDLESQRLGIGIMSLIAAIGGLALIVVLSVLIIAYQIGTAILTFVAPLFLLIGAHPGFGRGIALKWAELLVSTILKRVVVSALLGVMIAFYTMILNNVAASGQYGVSIIMIIALSIAGLMYRKSLMSAFDNVKFGGTDAGLNAGGGQKFKQGGTILAGTAAGLAAGAVGAGAVAAAAGGGKAGAAAAVRTIGKAGVSGAQRGAYAHSGKAATVGGLRAGRNATNASKGVHEAVQVERTNAQKAREAEVLEEKRLGDAKVAAEEQQKAMEADPTFYAKKKAKEASDRKREISEYLANREDPEYMQRLEAKHGGEIPKYLTEAVPRPQEPAPQQQVDTTPPNPGKRVEDNGQGALFDRQGRGYKDEPEQMALFPETPRPQSTPVVAPVPQSETSGPKGTTTSSGEGTKGSQPTVTRSGQPRPEGGSLPPRSSQSDKDSAPSSSSATQRAVPREVPAARPVTDGQVAKQVSNLHDQVNKNQEEARKVAKEQKAKTQSVEDTVRKPSPNGGQSGQSGQSGQPRRPLPPTSPPPRHGS